MQVITSWTGGRAYALQQSLRMSNQSFAVPRPPVRHSRQQFQQVTVPFRYREGNNGRCGRGNGSGNGRLAHDEAPVAGICERTPVPTGPRRIPWHATPLMTRSQRPATNRDLTRQMILERPCPVQPGIQPDVVGQELSLTLHELLTFEEHTRDSGLDLG
jgi:hypothetical protein